MLDWFKRNSHAISYFVAGWCSFACLDNLINGNYGLALLSAVLAFVNIKVAKL